MRKSAGTKAPRRAIGFQQPLKVAKKAVIKVKTESQYKKGDKLYWVDDNRNIHFITVENINPPDDPSIALTAEGDCKIYLIPRSNLHWIFKTEQEAKAALAGK
jgi:hypothetical protein